VARQSPHRRNAEEPEAVGHDHDPVAEETVSPDPDGPDRPAGEVGADRSADGTAAADRGLWDEARIHPVELALPTGVGLTLRAYRPSTEVTPTEVADREDEDPFAAKTRADAPEDDDEEVVILDEEYAALLRDEGDEDEASRSRQRGSGAAEEGDGAGADDEGDADDEEPEAEEVPVFLSHRGRLLLFKSPESLVAFVRSGAPHDLAQLDTWTQVAERVQPADVVAAEEDSYELDLVVENLRGGHDTWDLDLLIHAGEGARDLAYGLRLTPVLTALSPGSPLDELDDALRAAAAGGFAGFRGRRRLRRIGAQQASLGWRTIIGKISAAVDWRD